MDYGTGDH